MGKEGACSVEVLALAPEFKKEQQNSRKIRLTYIQKMVSLVIFYVRILNTVNQLSLNGWQLIKYRHLILTR